MTWFHTLSSTQLAVVVIAVTLAISLVGLAVTARRVRATSLHQTLDNGAISGLLAALIGIYAIAAGLTAVAVWGNVGDATSKVGREATAISVLFHDFAGYPEPQRTEFRKVLIDYTRHVVEQEWPLHERGEAPTELLSSVAAFENALLGFEPTTEGQKIVHAQAIAAYNHLLDARRMRLQAVTDTALPLALWIVVLLLGVIAISACFLLRMESFTMHAAITIIVAAPIALILYFIAVTDRPFQGGVNVSAEPYRDVLAKIMVPETSRK